MSVLSMNARKMRGLKPKRHPSYEINENNNVAKRAKINLSASELDLAARKLEIELERDTYCWKCHEPDTTLNCSNCTRTYHALCLEMDNNVPDNWQCRVCDDIVAAKRYWTYNFLDKSLLPYMVKCLLYNENFKIFRNINNLLTKSLANQLPVALDLNQMHAKVKRQSYEVPEEIFFDVKTIQHKIFVHYPENTELQFKIIELIKAAKKEVDDIKSCSECYRNRRLKKKDWMTSVCERPHLLVWAKVGNYPYWPAKILSYDEKSVHVEFFGDHSTADVRIEMCFLYSKEYPSNSDEQMSKDLKTAIKQTQEHVDKFFIKFGKFCYGEKCEPLEMVHLENQLQTMIYSDEVQHSNTTEDNTPIIQKNSKRTALVAFGYTNCFETFSQSKLKRKMETLSDNSDSDDSNSTLN